MSQIAVIQLSGKQYIVHQGAELVVDKVPYDTNASFEAPVLMSYDHTSHAFEIGSPELKKKATLEVVSHMKGDKIRVAKFKAKVRYRRANGFRPSLSKIKVVTI